MKLRIFTLPWDDAAARFEDRELHRFLDPESPAVAPDVIEVAQHFLVHERRPVWAIMVMYREGDASPRARADRDFRKDWRAELDEPGRKQYDELRLWRAKAAKREGLPPYLICNNRQLAEMVTRKPASLTALRDIEGFGEAKAARWGEEILVMFGKPAAAASLTPVSPAPEGPRE